MPQTRRCALVPAVGLLYSEDMANLENFTPAYLTLPPGELKRRVEAAYARMAQCDLCARNCGVNRLEGEMGVCRTVVRARVSSYGPHLGEEDPLRGWCGSGTIFFSRCNLRCQFCQNFEISQRDSGEEVSAERLAQMMLDLQARGCHNINLVSPSHVVAQILEAVLIAAGRGLRLPLVYNTGGYDSLAALRLLDGVVDIYMPDMKYAHGRMSRRFSGVSDYPQVNRAAVREMYRQVGDLQVDEQGLARRGLLVRHLVLPNDVAGTDAVMRFLAEEISASTYVNLMDQYRPAYRAHRIADLNRRITEDEYRRTVQMAQEAGLRRLDRRRAYWLVT